MSLNTFMNWQSLKQRHLYFSDTVAHRVIFASLLFTLQCCAHVLSNVSRDTIFLRSYQATNISSLTLFLSCTIAIIMSESHAILMRIVRILMPNNPACRTRKLSQLLDTTSTKKNTGKQEQKCTSDSTYLNWITSRDENRAKLYMYPLCPGVLSVGQMILAFFSLYFPVLNSYTSVMIYIWIEIAAQLMTQQFWDFCSRNFNVTEAKQYFGFITFGSTFGSLIASLVLLPFLQKRNMVEEWNLVLAASLQAMLAGILSVYTWQKEALMLSSSNTAEIARSVSKSHVKSATRNPRVASSRLWTIIPPNIAVEIKKRTYLQHICIFEFFSTIVRVLVDNSALSILSEQKESDIKSSLAMMSSIQSVLMIPLQIVSGRFFGRYGVMVGISLLPLSVSFYGITTLLISASCVSKPTGILLLILHRALYLAISLAIFNPARELLWLPLNDRERPQFKSFVYGPFRSISRIVGALFTMVLTSSICVGYLGSSTLSILLVTISVLWLLNALAAKKSYTIEFYASLKKGYLDLRSHIIDFTPDQIAVVKGTLASGAQDQVNYVLNSLTPSHIPIFAQELRALFYRTDHENFAVTPLSIKLRLLKLHTLAKKQFVLKAKDSFVIPDGKSCPPSIFNSMDLMLLVAQDRPQSDSECDSAVTEQKNGGTAQCPQWFVPRQLRVAAILACGYEIFSTDNLQCRRMLEKLLSQEREDSEDNAVSVCAAVALLRLTDWMDERANMILQRLLHEEEDLEARVICLRVVGEEIPELLGDGFLVYLLHHESEQIVQATVECCLRTSRQSRMLIPALIQHLGKSSVQIRIVKSLQRCDARAVWLAISRHIEELVQDYFGNSAAASHPEFGYDHTQAVQKRKNLIGALKILETIQHPVEPKVEFIVQLCLRIVKRATPEVLNTKMNLPMNSAPYQGDDQDNSLNPDYLPPVGYQQTSRSPDLLHRLFGRNTSVVEMLIDTLMPLLTQSDSKSLASQLEPLDKVLNAKIQEAYEMAHVMKLFKEMCPHTASNIGEKSLLILQHVQQCLADVRRMILKLLATRFPKEFNIRVIIEGLDSEISQIQAAVFEVLDNLVSSNYKHFVLPLLFPSTSFCTKLLKQVETFFEGKKGMQLLLETLQEEQLHNELTGMALQYFLHISEFHANLIESDISNVFNHRVLPQLLKHSITREVLVETYHKNRSNYPYESLVALESEAIPIISQIATSTCLRASTVFATAYTIDILRSMSYQFVPVRVKKGETFITEGAVASAVYIVAVGKVHVHKKSYLLAEITYGGCIGQTALLRHHLRPGVHISSATASIDCILLSISRPALDALMRENGRISLGVLQSVASAFRFMYFKPRRIIMEKGTLPIYYQKNEIAPSDTSLSPPTEDDSEPLQSSSARNISFAGSKALLRRNTMFLAREASSTSTHEQDKIYSLDRHQSDASQGLASTSNFISSSCADREYTEFEKCINLKGSHLLRSLADDKVSLVAYLAQVRTLLHKEVLFLESDKATHFFIIINGTMTISYDDKSQTCSELHNGDCLGEESFDCDGVMQGSASSKGRTTLFEFLTSELIELSQSQPELMHALLAWLADKLSKSVESMFEFLDSTCIPPSACQPVVVEPTEPVPRRHETLQKEDACYEGRREIRTRRGYRAQST